MKKLLFGLIAIVGFSSVGNAQTSANRTLIGCIKTSCCGIGPFGIEIWSQTTCYYYNKAGGGKIIFNNVKDGAIENPTDYILPGSYENTGSVLVLPKGTYQVKNNEVAFSTTDVTSKAKIHCITREIQGEFFGHGYSSSVSLCWISFKTGSNNGYVSINPKFTKEEKLELANSDNEINILKDIEIKNEDSSAYTVKAGKYQVAEDGLIYIKI